MKKFSVGTYYKVLPYDQYLRSMIRIGYNNDFKGPSFVWYRLSKGNINRKNIKKRKLFIPDYRLDKKIRVSSKDYEKSGYDKGHLASDASFDYSEKALDDIYVYSNAIPQKHRMNAYVWGGMERYARYIAMSLKYVYVVNMVKYGDKTMGNEVGIPDIMYKIIMNNKNKFLKIFKVKQDDTTISLKHYVITYEELMNDLK